MGHPVVMPQDVGVGRVRRLQTRKIEEDEGSQELLDAPMGWRLWVPRGQLPSLLGSSVQGAISVASSSRECCGISMSTREAEQGTGHRVLGFYIFNNVFIFFLVHLRTLSAWERLCFGGGDATQGPVKTASTSR